MRVLFKPIYICACAVTAFVLYRVAIYPIAKQLNMLVSAAGVLKCFFVLSLYYTSICILLHDVPSPFTHTLIRIFSRVCILSCLVRLIFFAIRILFIPARTQNQRLSSLWNFLIASIMHSDNFDKSPRRSDCRRK